MRSVTRVSSFPQLYHPRVVNKNICFTFLPRCKSFKVCSIGKIIIFLLNIFMNYLPIVEELVVRKISSQAQSESISRWNNFNTSYSPTKFRWEIAHQNWSAAIPSPQRTLQEGCDLFYKHLLCPVERPPVYYAHHKSLHSDLTNKLRDAGDY